MAADGVAAHDAASGGAHTEPEVELDPWTQMPDPLRTRLAEIGATALGGMSQADVPASLRRFARFTPAKRARLGGTVLCAELERSEVFRTAVVAWWTAERPGELTTTADDRLDAAAAALLTGAHDAPRLVAAAERHGELGEVRAERDEALARVDKLTAEMERLRGELVEARDQARTAAQHREAEYQQLRRTVSDQGTKLRAATDARTELEETVARLRSGSDERVDEARAECTRLQDALEQERRKSERAAREVAAARQAAREARQGDEVRLSLLLDTLGGAVNGMRRELSLGGDGPRPGDTVRGARGITSAGGTPVDDLASLDSLLALPAVHLVVDGYNVSKTGYPDLPLADQRTRLVTQLAALRSRTGIEITVVFDGAAVVAAPLHGTRGVRVLFSEPDVLADDVVRDLVAAEPRGRPLLVATSDQEVVRSVRRRGAHTVPSAVLLQRLRAA
nr:NYN domain-containing protein [Pseudonocardia endophytica]